MRLTFVDLTWTGIFLDSHLLTMLGAAAGTVVSGLARRSTDARQLGAGKASGDLPSS